ncbi:small leucine-rich protein 1 [Pelobates fuscus]|uniref:small leucine-rich protein 1 n=1 Tax=Pelobates fuscus TaxID=191477 RepID=UPI002FE48B9D
MGHIISVFVRELPAWYIFGGIFLPVAILLLGIMRYLWIQLEEVNEQLAHTRDPKEALQDYYLLYKQLKTSKWQHSRKT